MTESALPRRRRRRSSTTDVDSVVPQPDLDDDVEATVLGSRRVSSTSSEFVSDDVEATELGSRRTTSASISPEVIADDIEATVLGSRRTNSASVSTEFISDDLEATALGSRRVNSSSTEFVSDDFDATELGSRRTKAAAGSEADELEPTDPSARRRGRPVGEPGDDTAVSQRPRKSMIESTLRSLRKPKPAPTIDESFSLAGRRTVQIVDVGDNTTTRAAFAPQQAILKAPYRPRKQVVIPVVHLDRQAPARPPKPIEESMSAIRKRHAAARRRRTLMAVAGGTTMALSAGGIVVLLMLG